MNLWISGNYQLITPKQYSFGDEHENQNDERSFKKVLIRTHKNLILNKLRLGFKILLF